MQEHEREHAATQRTRAGRVRLVSQARPGPKGLSGGQRHRVSAAVRQDHLVTAAFGLDTLEGEEEHR